MRTMRRAARAFAFAVLGLFFGFNVSAQTPPSHPPVEAFGALPEVSQPSMSPDGKHVATIQGYNGKPIVRIFTLDPPGTPAVAVPLSQDNAFVIGVQWANNDRLLVTLNVNQQLYVDRVVPWYRLIAIDSHGAKPTMMFGDRRASRDVQANAAVVSDLAPDDPAHIYMPLYNDFSGRAQLSQSMADFLYSMFKVDVNTGNSVLAARGGMNTRDWIMDGHGNVVARIDQTDNPRTDHLKLYAGGAWKEIETVPATVGHGLSVPGLTDDGKSLVQVIINDQTGTYGLAARSISGDEKKLLYSDPHYDVSSALLDPWTRRVIGASAIDDMARDIYFDPSLVTMQAKLQMAFPDEAVHAVAWDLERKTVIASVEGPRLPASYFLYNTLTDKLSRISRTYGGLQPSDLGEMKSYSYKARDGLAIHAYLTLPPGKEAKNLPVIIMPHGGPMARDQIRFDWDAQFLANRGYAVLQPNFRGSSGYGLKFMEAGYGEWGLKMQDDVTDGVKRLIADGIADPKRICIVGGSYGAYAALAGAAFTPDLYACAAGWAGVYDLQHFLVTRAKDYGKDSEMIDSWQRFIGDRWDDSAKLDSVSPAENADKIKCPVLLMHGADDTTVRVDQSEAMERALRRAGKKVSLIVIPKETHYRETEATRIRWLTELEKFLKENIGN